MKTLCHPTILIIRSGKIIKILCFFYKLFWLIDSKFSEKWANNYLLKFTSFRQLFLTSWIKFLLDYIKWNKALGRVKCNFFCFDQNPSEKNRWIIVSRGHHQNFSPKFEVYLLLCSIIQSKVFIVLYGESKSC